MNKYIEKANRPVVSLEEMKENDYLLKKSFNVFKMYYSVTARARCGIMTVADMKSVIERSINEYKDHEEKERLVIEGFYEFVMGYLLNFSGSIECFKAVEKLFGWR